MIIKIADRISAVMTEQGFLFSNAMLIEDDVRVMIDSGAGSIMASAEPAKADILLVSHHHLDHINGNDQFVNARIMAHPIEREAMKDPHKTTATAGWEQLMGDDIMNHVQQLGGVNPRILEPWPVHEDLTDGQVIDTGHTKIVVMLTPGHTAGHLSFYFPEEEAIFTGDICLTQVGPWYGDPDVSIDEFLASIDRIISLNVKKLVTGHLTSIVDGEINARLAEYRDRIYKREKRILKALEEGPAGIDELADRKLIYRLHPTTFVLFWEKAMVKKHLDRLADQNLVERVNDGRYRARG